MPMEQPFSHQYIIERLNAHYGIKIVTLTFLPLGADNNALVYKAEAQHNPPYFVKLKHGHHHDTGITILQLLHEAGIQQIIPPVKTLQGYLTQRVGSYTIILYPFIEGQDGFTRALTDKQWLILGRTLRQVHEINVPLSIRQSIRHECFSSKWREFVRSLYAHINAKSTGDKVALDLLAFMKKHILIIRRLVERAERLAQILPNQLSQFVLCHSDIHAGNILINNDNTIYIVDWDDPVMAPKERDLMFIGGGVANVWNKPCEEALFYQGYGKIELNRTFLAYYRYERIVEDIAEYGQELLLTSQGSDENRLEMLQHFIAMFEPKGVVDIAFKSDETFGHNEPISDALE